MALVAACASLAFACEKIDSTPETVPSGDGRCSLELRFSDGASGTKLTGQTLDNESMIQNVQIFVFRTDEDNVLDASVSEGFDTPLNFNASASDYKGITLSCTTGSREIWAVVNAAEDFTADGSVARKEDLLAKTTLLADNSATGLFMIGSKTAVLTAGRSTQTVTVRRICASVVLESVTNAMVASAYQKPGSFRIKDIYLLNVPAKINFGASMKAASLEEQDWYARMSKEGDADKSRLILDKASGPVVIDYQKTDNTRHSFYSYPNECSPSKEGTWSPRATLLVIDAEFLVDGTWHSCYYPVTLFDEAEGTGLQSNRQYKVRLTMTINRPGSDDPNHPVEFDTVSGVIDVADWETGTEYTETI